MLQCAPKTFFILILHMICKIIEHFFKISKISENSPTVQNCNRVENLYFASLMEYSNSCININDYFACFRLVRTMNLKCLCNSQIQVCRCCIFACIFNIITLQSIGCILNKQMIHHIVIWHKSNLCILVYKLELQFIDKLSSHFTSTC